MSARTLRALHLPVRAEALSALPRDVALVLCPPRSLAGLIDITSSLTAPLGTTPLSAPHRRGHEQHHKHDRGGYRDHNNASTNREHNKGGAHPASPFARPTLSIPATTVKPAPLARSSRLRIIDRGRVVVEDTPAARKVFFGSDSLEDVYLRYTGNAFAPTENALLVTETAAAYAAGRCSRPTTASSSSLLARR